MSVNDLVDEIEAIARCAVLDAKAVYICPFHEDAIISNGDPDAENMAYAIATNKLKKDNIMFLREDLMHTVKYELDMADDQCNQCASQGEA